MMKRKLNKYLLLTGTVIAAIAVALPMVGAYEGHLIDVKAHEELSEAQIDELFCHGTTRTPGWWQTHVAAAEYVLAEIGPIDMGWPGEITNIDDLMGVFWASQTHNSDGTKRDKLCKAKAQASFQVLAAILNAGSPNGLPIGFLDTITMEEIRGIMGGSDADAILALHDRLSAFNSDWDFDDRPMGFPSGIENESDPNLAKEIANLPFADCN